MNSNRPEDSRVDLYQPPVAVAIPSSVAVPAPEQLPQLGRSLGWAAIFLLAFFLAAILYMVGYGAALGFDYAVQGVLEPDPAVMEREILQHIGSPGGIVGVYLMQLVLMLPLVYLAAHFPQQSWRETLGFNRFKVSVLGYWMLVLLGFLVVEYVLNRLLAIDPGDFMRSLSGTKHLPVTLVIIICAPILEELIFRGYFFKAWRHTRLGLSGTLLLTSLLFTGLHAGQYGWSILAMLFTFSIILGLAREKSGSVWVPIIIHALNNSVAAVTVVYLGLL